MEKSIKVDKSRYKKKSIKKMKVEESRKKVELKSTFSRVEKMKVEVDKSTRTFECSTFFRSVHATGRDFCTILNISSLQFY